MTRAGEEMVRAAFRAQAAHSALLGSPFTGRVSAQLAERIDRSSAIGARVLDWEGDPEARYDALPLRLLGGLHALVRAGEAPELAAVYPPHAPADDGDLGDRLAMTLRLRSAALLPWLDSPPQTNEVRRAALLMAGLAVITEKTGLPLALHELGPSAGLNLVLDRYAFRLGGQAYGRSGSPVTLEPVWKGGPPPAVEPSIRSARGVDLRPIDVSRPEHRERLMAYIWPDQTERLARTAAAIALAADAPPRIDAAEAADWTEQRLAEPPEEGVVRVFMHTIAFQYFQPSSQQRIANALATAGEHASRQAPLAWLRFEMPQRGDLAELRLTLWPDGTERLLATADPHVRAVHWL